MVYYISNILLKYPSQTNLHAEVGLRPRELPIMNIFPHDDTLSFLIHPLFSQILDYDTELCHYP